MQADVQDVITVVQNLIAKGGNFEAAFYCTLENLLPLFPQEPGHKRFIVSQYRLVWSENPAKWVIPDLFVTDIEANCIGGAEMKRGDGGRHTDQMKFWAACIQAADQVKAATKHGLKHNDRPVPWLVCMGVYISLRLFGPFNLEDPRTTTRLHRRHGVGHDSGDYDFSQMAQEALQAVRPFEHEVVRMDSPEGIAVLQKFLDLAVSLVLLTHRSHQAKIILQSALMK